MSCNRRQDIAHLTEGKVAKSNWISPESEFKLNQEVYKNTGKFFNLVPKFPEEIETI